MINKFVNIISILILLFNFSCSPKSKLKENESLVISKVLTAKGLGGLELGTPFSEVKKRFSDYRFQEEIEFWGYMLTNPDSSFKIFLSVYDDTLQGVTISDTKFRLFNGLRAGDGVIKIKQLFPSVPLTYNLHDDAEQFVVQDVNSLFLINVISNDGKLLGDYKNELPDSTFNFRFNGKIESIGVFRK